MYRILTQFYRTVFQLAAVIFQQLYFCNCLIKVSIYSNKYGTAFQHVIHRFTFRNFLQNVSSFNTNV